MKQVYYIFVMQINAESNHGVELHPVFTEMTGKWLQFDTYDNAKSWIEENFKFDEHKNFAYQIQSVLVRK